MANIIASISNVVAGVTSAQVDGAVAANASVIRMDTFAGGTPPPALYSIFKIGTVWYQVISIVEVVAGVRYDIGCTPETPASIADNAAVSFVPDYTTILAWEAGTDIPLTANNIYIGEVWGGGGPYTDVLSIAGATVGGLAPTAVTHRKLRPGFGQQYNPVTRTGCYIENSGVTGTTAFVDILEAFFELEGMAIIVNYTTEATTRYIVQVNGGASHPGVIVSRCFLKATALPTTTSSLTGACVRVGANSNTGKIWNNVVVGKQLDTVGTFNGINVDTAGTGWIVANNSVYNFLTSSVGSHCIQMNASPSTILNNLMALSSGNNLAGTALISVNANFTGDESGSGFFPLTTTYWGSQPSEIWHYPNYDDLRLKYTSRAVDVAVHPASYPVLTFTDDYAGNTRVGLWECGAYNGAVVPDYNPPTVEIKSIGSGAGRDYATIAAWEAATRLHLVSQNKVCIGELYADSLFDLGTTLTNNANFYISGAITDATRYRQLRAAAGQAYDPVANVGVQLRGSSSVSGSTVLRINEDFFRFSGAQVENYYAGASTRTCIEVSANAVWLDKFVVRGNVGTTGTYFAGVFQQSFSDLLCTNGIAIGDLSTTNGLSRGFYIIAPALNPRIFNCVSYKIKHSGAYGFAVLSATLPEIKNCIAADCTTDFYNVDLTTRMFACISSDTTAVGIGSQISQSAASLFNDPTLTNPDLRLKAGSAALNTGLNLQLDFTDDFISQKRTAPWEVGAYNGIVVEIQGAKTDRLNTMRFATCWKIERKDGFAVYATDHNSSITLQGQIYTPTGGFDSSAVRRELGMKTDDTEFAGVVTSDVIMHEDLRGGRFNLSKVTEYVVDWRYPWAQPQIVASYYIVSVEFDAEVWKANVSGIAYLMQQKAGRNYYRQCDAVLYDKRCGVQKLDHTIFDKEIDTVTSKTVFTVVGGGLSVSLYKYGMLTWLTGPNVGIECECRDNTATTITLQMQLPYTPQPGDTFDLSEGCAHTQADCKDKFVNIVNYRGYREVPGTDKQLQTPLQ